MNSELFNKKPKILVVDDDKTMLRGISTLIDFFGEITTATSVYEANSFIQSIPFDVVITDYELGNGNGIEVLKCAQSICPHLPVIIITAFGSKELAIHTLNKHVFGFLEKPFEPVQIEELTQLAIKKKQEIDFQIIQLNMANSMSQITQQVAHDIKSPLATLKTIANDMLPVSNDDHLFEKSRQNLLRTVISRIDGIISELLINRHTSSALPNSNLNFFYSRQLQPRKYISTILEELINEKIAEYRSRPEVIIAAEIDKKCHDLIIDLNETTLKRILSNLINNSVEAIDKSGEIKITLTKEKKQVIIIIKDSGSGIPPEILHQIGERGKTFGKRTGSGLGLSFAVTQIEQYGGKIEIESQISSGTAIQLYLPFVKTKF